MFWVLLTLSLACAAKLDRTYLPPPGSQHAGGRPEDIQVPFEYSEINYPSRSNYVDDKQSAIGIERKGPKEISEGEKNINFSESSLPQVENIAQKATARPVLDNYFITSSTASNYVPKHSSGESPDITKFYSGQNEQQNINYSYPEKYLANGQIYPGQVLNGNSYANTAKQKITNNYVSTPQPYEMHKINNGDLDGLISISCNSSLTKGLENGNCIFNTNSDQDLSTPTPTSAIMSVTLIPTTIIRNNSLRHSSKNPQSNENIATAINYSSTTKSPFNYFDTKHPERIQAKSDREAVILNYENVLTPEGYAYSFDTSNGIHGDESGIAIDGARVKGSYSYIGDDGKNYRITYTADENGFRPEGDHLPTSPPIPDAILRVIEKAYEDKKAGIIDDGSYDDNKYGYKKYKNDFYKPNLFNSINKNANINEDINAKYNNIPFNQQNVQYSKKKQDDLNIPYKQKPRPENINNYGDPKKSSMTMVDDYKEVGSDDKTKTDYQKFYITKPKYSQNYNKSGSPYYFSQKENIFPTRFPEIYNKENEETYQENTKEIPKTFITPYVFRNDEDELQNYNNKEKIYNKPGHYFNDEIHQKYNNDNYPVEGLNKKEQSYIFYSSDKNDESTHNGYFYPKAVNTDGTSFKHFSDDLSYISTNGPFEFSTSSSTVPYDKKYYGPELIFKSSTTPSSVDTASEYQTSLFPYKNVNEETKEPMSNNYYPSTENNIRDDIPKFAPSYSLDIGIMDTDTFKIPSGTERTVGEDFYGPKRPQSFNSLTGYQY